MESVVEIVHRIAWGDLSWTAGGGLVALGAALLVATLAWPAASNSESVRLVVRMRRLIWGLALVSLGAGLVFQQPVLVALGLVFGFEETLETGIVLYALRNDPAA